MNGLREAKNEIKASIGGRKRVIKENLTVVAGLHQTRSETKRQRDFQFPNDLADFWVTPIIKYKRNGDKTGP